MIKRYYHLAKPGIVYGNAFVAAAAFIFASHSGINWTLFFVMLGGLSSVVAAACVFNNIADRALDAKMKRTAARGLAAGAVTPRAAGIYGLILLALGVVLLLLTNPPALDAALFGFIVYVFAYTPLKPRTGYALFVGAVAGAMPPVVGYAAAAGVIDSTALLLFAFLFIWQIPHFLSIARYRYDEYRAAGVPLLVREPTNEIEKEKARATFYGSLIVLVLFCVLLCLFSLSALF